MLWFVLLLACGGVVVFAIWDYRRKTAARSAASKARFEQVFTERAPSAQPDGSTAPVVPVTAVPTSPAPQPSAPIAAVPAGDRFLGRSEAVIYRLLKRGLPDHEIFAKVMLSSVVSASGSGHQREQQVRRLTQYQVDFVVCDRDMRIIAAVEVETASGSEAIGMRRFKADCLKAAGIPLVQINAASPPRWEDMRALLGAGAPPPSAA